MEPNAQTKDQSPPIVVDQPIETGRFDWRFFNSNVDLRENQTASVV
jgi:hypothetical protein